MVKEIGLFYFPRYHQYFVNGNSTLTYQNGKSVGFDTLQKALDYLIREEGKRSSILSLDERCTQEIISNEDRPKEIQKRINLDEELGGLYLTGTKIEIYQPPLKSKS